VNDVAQWRDAVKFPAAGWALNKEKSPDTTPGFFNNTWFFGWGTTPNDFRLADWEFSSCHQCWGHALALRSLFADSVLIGVMSVGGCAA